MRKGIGPQGLGAPKSPAKQTTNEFGEKGQFNPYTEDVKKMGGQHRTSFRNAGQTEYSEKYQNKWVRSTKDPRISRGSTIGDQEHTMRRKHKTDSIVGARRDAYIAREENNFGVKKPKVNIK